MRSIIQLAVLLAVALAPLPLKAAEGAAVVQEADSCAVRITVEAQSVRVAGAEGQTLKVFSISGRQLMAVRIVSNEQRMEWNLPKGCYIIKVGKVTRKVVF